MLPLDLKAVKEAADPFDRLLRVIDALPPGAVANGDGLRGMMPGVWPTLGDLRKLVSIIRDGKVVTP